MKKAILLFAYLFICFGLFAQEMVTDRPDQTESAYTVPKHMLQIETGASIEGDKANGLETTTKNYGSTLLRYGLLDNLELRFGFDYQDETVKTGENSPEINTAGFAPLEVGMKLMIIEEKGWVPRLALLGGLTIPRTGESDFSTQYYAPMFRLNGEYTLAEWVSFGFNLGAEWDGYMPNATGYYSGVFGFGLTDWLAGFIEAYGFLTEELKPDHRSDAGFTFLVLPNLQFDLSGGFGLSKVSPDYFMNCGVTWRIPR